MLRDQNEYLNEICFELYGKGLTTEQVEEIIGKAILQAIYQKSIQAFMSNCLNDAPVLSLGIIRLFILMSYI
jgi:hypothetical protein